MPRFIQKTLSLFILIFVSLHVSAQQVQNVNARLSGENVIITYDLVGGQVGQKFNIQLYSSNDDYQQPLELVEGRVGEEQLGGAGKQITWRAKEELGVFSGNITFEVRATMTFNPINITKPTASSTFKVGKSMPIAWNGGMPDATIQIELMKTNTLDRPIGVTQNTHLYNWDIPKDVSRGSDYQVRMFDVNDRNNTQVISSSFVIKPKGGAGKIIIPVLAVGAGAGALCALKVICPEKPINGETTDLPPPPDPGDSLGGATRLKPAGIPMVTISF